MDLITTFPKHSEFEKAIAAVNSLALEHLVVDPSPRYRHVGVPALALRRDAIGKLISAGKFTCSGWVDYRKSSIEIPPDESVEFDADIFGHAAIMLLAPCVADTTRIRIIVHISGNLTEAMPYLNATMPEAFFNPNMPALTFRDGYRMIALYGRRITVAKADEIVDAWRVLEMIRRRANEAWNKRGEIEPDYKSRKRPPALEIIKRLPQTNCGQCGEKTCTAFAVRVYEGELPVTDCRPVFNGNFGNLRDALLEICAGLGVK